MNYFSIAPRKLWQQQIPSSTKTCHTTFAFSISNFIALKNSYMEKISFQCFLQLLYSFSGFLQLVFFFLLVASNSECFFSSSSGLLLLRLPMSLKITKQTLMKSPMYLIYSWKKSNGLLACNKQIVQYGHFQLK